MWKKVVGRSVEKPWFSRITSVFSRKKPKHPRRNRIIQVSLLVILLIAIFSYFTNPFVRFSLVDDPFLTVSQEDGKYELEMQSDLILRDQGFASQLAYIKSSWHIATNKFSRTPRAKKATVDEIIEEIHRLRFDPELPFLISGDHFSVLYPRSLGIFYHSALDPRTALNQEDWDRRQQMYLKTTAYALQVFGQSDNLSTTIVPVAPKSVAMVNFHAPPSDTLYSVLYGLRSLQSIEAQTENYPFESEQFEIYPLQTASSAAQLLENYGPKLTEHVNRYMEETYDPELGLVKRDLHLSGTKDQFFRESAFYDNVIMWRTHQMAQELDLIPEDQEFLDTFKQKILDTFWLEEEGYFLEELYPEAVENKHYSSDWLIVLMAGFLSPLEESERQYFERSYEYIRRNGIDQPFGLQYHSDLRKNRQHIQLRLLAPSYGTTAIWSNWGQEYIKMLSLLARETGEREYLDVARDQLEAYTFNIRRYRGYPELYNENGDVYSTFSYKSIRRTGWVVSFEQSRELFKSVEAEMEN